MSRDDGGDVPSKLGEAPHRTVTKCLTAGKPASGKKCADTSLLDSRKLPARDAIFASPPSLAAWDGATLGRSTGPRKPDESQSQGRGGTMTEGDEKRGEARETHLEAPATHVLCVSQARADGLADHGLLGVASYRMDQI